ncbi:hypothetical protein GTP46_22960 [Duganella sp. FT135W]|uniref:Uncharacterized protein n=1 Tax=Duganella flavida TaxID=2692175 RepID=A0A6L8KEI8_9BURK|nr:hypothetical protein [Duganella flavida]MYM25495.1 hypothetical protein [Duganella flavida]
MTSYLYKIVALGVFFSISICCTASETEKTPTTISVGAIRDEIEGSAVRVLAKMGDAFAINEQLQATIPSQDASSGTFNILSREVKIDASEKGKFGSATFRYGIQHYLIGLESKTLPDGTVIRKSNGQMHVITAHFGADTDRSTKNRDLLLEVGYVPVYISQDETCWKLGVNPIIGISAQIGKRYRSTDPEYILTPGENSGGLRRVKAEGRLDFPLSCFGFSPGESSKSAAELILADISRWKIQMRSVKWRDFSEAKNYTKHELVIRIPTGVKAGTYMDLRREIGASPIEFDTGAKFGINFTLEF